MHSAPPKRRPVAGGGSSGVVVARVWAVGILWLMLAAAGFWWLVFLPAQRMDVLAAEREADVCEGFLRTEMARLRATALDWANWDDLERYLQNPEEQFALQNVTQAVLRNLDIHGMLLVKQDGDLQRREVTGPARSLYMGSANFLERIATLRARAARESAASAVVGSAGHLYVVAVAPVLGTDASGPSSGEVVVFSVLTDAELGSRPGVDGTTFALLPPDAQPLPGRVEGKTVQSSGPMVTRVINGPDGREAARMVVSGTASHAELARRAAILFAAAVVLLAVGIGAMAKRAET